MASPLFAAVTGLLGHCLTAPRHVARTPARLALACLVASCVASAGSAVLSRSLMDEMGWSQLMVVRFAVGLGGLAALFAMRQQGPRLHAWRLLSLRGGLGALDAAAFYYAMGTVPAAAVVLLNNSYPVYVPFLAAAFLRERMHLRTIAAACLAVAGTGLIAASPGEGGLSLVSLSPGVLAAAASGMIGAGAVTTMRALRTTGGTDAGSVVLSYCVASLLLAAPFSAPDWTAMGAATVLGALTVGVFSLVSQLLFSYALQHVSAGTGAVMMQLTPVAAYCLGAVALGEVLSLRANIGVGCAMLGTFLAIGRSVAPPLSSTSGAPPDGTGAPTTVI